MTERKLHRVEAVFNRQRIGMKKVWSKITSRKERHLELNRGLCQSNRWVIEVQLNFQSYIRKQRGVG